VRSDTEIRRFEKLASVNSYGSEQVNVHITNASAVKFFARE
jgi:hypothetical protein